ncbi:uncharacterized protein FRV6_16013 [Fusarium oxysporum]|uniref:Uncharacterized protein n=1 Tax=Fusarium oxysporum TaxID=5507 RepID=A0A2H3TW71_FUSOX|nr:uncharacterized protein FRV6_16013 [Fusarium oxysporum]
MQMPTVLLNALLAFSGVAALHKGEPAASAKLIDINSVGEVSEISESEIAPAGTKTVFDEQASPNPGLNKRQVLWGLCLGNAGLPSRKVEQYKSDVRSVFDEIAQWDPRSQRSVSPSNRWHWSGPTAGGYRRVMITVHNQVLALVLRNWDSARSGWAYVSPDHVLVAIVHDRTIPPPQPHLTC